MSETQLNKKTFRLQVGVSFAIIVSIIYYTYSFVETKLKLENSLNNCHIGINGLDDRVQSLELDMRRLEIEQVSFKSRVQHLEQRPINQ